MSNVTREVIRKALKNKPKWVPRDLAYGARTQANWSKQTKGQNVADPLEIMDGLIEMEDGDTIVNHICNNAGGYFIREVEMDDRSKCLHSRVAKVFDKLTKVVVTVTDVVADNKITDAEIIMLNEALNEYTEVQKQLIDSAKKGYWS